MRIAVIALDTDHPGTNALAHGATRLADMTTVAEATVVEQASHLRKTLVQLLRRERPKTDLAQSRCVDDVTVGSAGKRQHERSNGRVPALVDRFADRADTKIGAGEECVEQR